MFTSSINDLHVQTSPNDAKPFFKVEGETLKFVAKPNGFGRVFRKTEGTSLKEVTNFFNNLITSQDQEKIKFLNKDNLKILKEKIETHNNRWDVKFSHLIGDRTFKIFGHTFTLCRDKTIKLDSINNKFNEIKNREHTNLLWLIKETVSALPKLKVDLDRDNAIFRSAFFVNDPRRDRIIKDFANTDRSTFKNLGDEKPEYLVDLLKLCFRPILNNALFEKQAAAVKYLMGHASSGIDKQDKESIDALRNMLKNLPENVYSNWREQRGNARKSNQELNLIILKAAILAPFLYTFSEEHPKEWNEYLEVCKKDIPYKLRDGEKLTPELIILHCEDNNCEDNNRS
jgi:hypothetical protein